jgi:FimV-like protein
MTMMLWPKIAGFLFLIMLASSTWALPQQSLTLPVPTHNKTLHITAASNPAAATQQFLALQQDFSSYKQQTDQRLKLLQQQAGVMQIEISQLTALVEMFKQQLSHFNLSNTNNTAPQHPAPNNTSPTWQAILPKDKITTLIALLSLILIVWIWMPSTGKAIYKRQEPKIDDDADTEKEYDFMNSQEAIPAKLDLARAYIAMEDFGAAKQVLKEVLQQGNSREQLQAKQLLGGI